MSKLPIELKYTGKMLRKKITHTAKFLNALPIEDDYKDLFLRTYGSRGWQNIEKLAPELITIADYGCDVTKMFLEQKLIGVHSLYRVVISASESERAEIYQLIKNGGVKPHWRDIERLLKTDTEPRLFNVSDMVES